MTRAKKARVPAARSPSPRAKAANDPGRAAWARLVDAAAAENQERSRICAEFELSLTQACMLRYLDPAQPMPMNVLAEAFSCEASNVTCIVDKLEARGLVQRRVSDEDRRVKMLVVTGEGTRLRSQLTERLEAPPVWIGTLSRAEQKELHDVPERALMLRGGAPPR